MNDMPFLLAVVAGGLVAGLFGIMLERGLFRRFLRNEMQGMILSLAVAIIFRALALILLGPGDAAMPRPVSGTWHVFGASIPRDRTMVAFCALVILAAVYAFIKYSRTGMAMRAVAQDPEVAQLVGVEVKSTYLLAFGLSCMLAGLAGALMAPIYNVSPFMGEMPMLKAFVVVILGGLGSVPGAIAGGLVLGLLESVLATLLNPLIALIACFALVMLIVIVRPNGLMGRAR